MSTDLWAYLDAMRAIRGWPKLDYVAMDYNLGWFGYTERPAPCPEELGWFVEGLSCRWTSLNDSSVDRITGFTGSWDESLHVRLGLEEGKGR